MLPALGILAKEAVLYIGAELATEAISYTADYGMEKIGIKGTAVETAIMDGPEAAAKRVAMDGARYAARELGLSGGAAADIASAQTSFPEHDIVARVATEVEDRMVKSALLATASDAAQADDVDVPGEASEVFKTAADHDLPIMAAAHDFFSTTSSIARSHPNQDATYRAFSAYMTRALFHGYSHVGALARSGDA